MGRHEVGFIENTVKTPIGNDQEGCLFEARFAINKVRLFSSMTQEATFFNKEIQGESDIWNLNLWTNSHVKCGNKIVVGLK